MAARKELKNTIKNLDQEYLKEYGAEMKMEWGFTIPDGPRRNGCLESWIKSIKKTISCAIDEQALTFSELPTVCFEAPNQVNERLIGRHPTKSEDLSSNHVVLGQTTSSIQAGLRKETVNLM